MREEGYAEGKVKGRALAQKAVPYTQELHGTREACEAISSA